MLEFTRPEWLLSLIAVPALVLLATRAMRRRRDGWKRLGKSSRIPTEGDWRWITALVLLILAAAGPSWDWKGHTAASPGHDVMLVVDTSRSMGVPDALPTRIGAAVQSAKSLVQAIGSEEVGRVGLVAFAGRGVVRCPLTTNLGVVNDALQALRPGDVQPGGTNLAAGVRAALDALARSDPFVPRTIVLFTDGEDLSGSWPELVARLRREKVTLHGVAVGDLESGHAVPIGGGKSLKFAGKTVESRRNDTPIEALAGASGGTVVRLGLAPTDLGAFFERRIQPFAARRREQIRRESALTDRHAPFVFFALAVGVSACGPRRFRGGGTVWLFLLVFLGASPRDVSTSEWVRQGKAAYDRGAFQEASAFFERAIRNDPRSAVAFYDAGAAAFQLGGFDEALRHYKRALILTKQDGLRMKTQFALGNVHLALGQRSQAIEAYGACIASTVAGPEYDAIRRDAAINRRFAEREPPRAEQSDPDGAGKEQGADPNRSKSAAQSPGKSSSPPESTSSSDADESGPSGSDAKAGDEPSPDSKTVKQRFQDSLENARQARDFRQADDGPGPTQDGVLKDW